MPPAESSKSSKKKEESGKRDALVRDSGDRGRANKRSPPWRPKPRANGSGELGLEKIEERPRQMSYREQREVVGKLLGLIDGEDSAILITLGNVFWIGRHPSCDLLLDSREVSNFHLRIYAVRTATDLSIVCVQDLSTNGFYLNGILYYPANSIEIGGRSFSHRSVVLRPGDKLRIPSVPTEEKVLRKEWTYVHNNTHHIASTIPPLEHPLPTSVLPLFPSRSTDLNLPRGPWEIHNYPLGSGTYGVVHLASHSIGGLQVACKTIARAKSGGVRDALKREVRVLMGLHHPNVLSILDMVEDDIPEDEEDGTPDAAAAQKYRPRMHLFLELVTGGDLFSYVEKYKTLTEDEVKWIAFQFIEGLGYIHSQDVAHRDIKPENILLYTSEAYPRIVIADFGMAITYDELLSTVPEHRHEESARRYMDIGTTSYLPPERLRAMIRRPSGQKGIGESLKGTGEARRRMMARRWFEEEVQLDIYGAGLTLFICASGQHPYAIDQDADAEGEEEEEVEPAVERDATVVPEGYRTREAYHGQKGKASWDTFRAMTVMQEEAQGVGKLQKEYKKYLELSLEFAVPVARWPQSNWANYSSNAKDFLRRLLVPTASERPSWKKMLLHSWWKKDLEYARLLHQKIVVQGRSRIPFVANASLRPARKSPESVPPAAKLTTYGKGKGTATATPARQQEPLIFSQSTQHTQLSQTYDPVESFHTEPEVRNGFSGRGRSGLALEDQFESIRMNSLETVSTPSTITAEETERSLKRVPGLDDLMRYGSTPRVLYNSDFRAPGGRGAGQQIKKGQSSRHPPRVFARQRRESLMDRIHEDDEDDKDGAESGEGNGDDDVEMEDAEQESAMSLDD